MCRPDSRGWLCVCVCVLESPGCVCLFPRPALRPRFLPPFGPPEHKSGEKVCTPLVSCQPFGQLKKFKKKINNFKSVFFSNNVANIVCNSIGFVFAKSNT